MRIAKLFLPALWLTLGIGASAQSAPIADKFGLEHGQTPVLEFGMNYTFLHANAPPSQCGCFSLNGGGGTLIINMPHGISLIADLSGAHANHVNSTTQNITIFNALFGGRYSYRTSHRFTPFVEGLAGHANEISNYTFVQSVSAFAAGGGIGVTTVLTRYIGWTIVEADFLYSQLPNASTNYQSDIRAVTGITFRFGPR